MAKAYIGADNAAKLVKAMYIGVDGVARKVTKAYRGVDGVAKLVYSEATKKEYLYGGTSTFVHTATDTTLGVSPGTDYTLTEDKFVLQVEKYDTIPLYVYIDGELVATTTAEGEQTISLDGWATTLASRGTITVTITSEGTYGLGEQEVYQFWDYTGSTKGSSDTTVYGDITSVTLSDNVTKIYNYALSRVTTDDVSIPSEGLIEIGSYACYECGMSTFTIPETVTTLGAWAFALSSLQSIHIPNGITIIEPYTFSSCISLQSINIPNSVVSIKNDAFYGCSKLEYVVIPSSVIEILARAFKDALIRNITFKHGASDSLYIFPNSEGDSDGAFNTNSSIYKNINVYHNGNEAVLNYDWALCNRTVTFIQE